MGSAVAVAVLPGGAVAVDPTRAEEAAAAAVLTFVLEGAGDAPASQRRVVAVDASGAVSEAQFAAALAAAAAAAQHVVTFSRMGFERAVQVRQQLRAS